MYYFPIQWWGWYNWVYGGQHRSELRVTWLANWERLLQVAIIVAGTLIFGRLLESFYDWALYTYWDASIVASSVAAQFLLTRKKVEAWFLWLIPVNVSAIFLYSLTGAYMFAALYVVFLVNAFAGVLNWIGDAKPGLQTAHAA